MNKLFFKAYLVKAGNFSAPLTVSKKKLSANQQCSVRSGFIFPFSFQIRDPPAEGVFLYGIYTWGFIWDKATGEVLDSLPKGGGGSSLPVVHLFYTHEPKDNLYPCPVYSCRETKNTEGIFELDIYKENVTLTRWSLRGIMATLQPF